MNGWLGGFVGIAAGCALVTCAYWIAWERWRRRQDRPQPSFWKVILKRGRA